MRTSISDAPGTCTDALSLKNWLRARAHDEGFQKVGVTEPGAIKHAAPRFYAFLEANFHGDMGWLAANSEKRADPAALWPDVKSIVVFGLNYGSAQNPLAALERKEHGAISIYAQGGDYHDLMKAKLKRLAREFVGQTGGDVKVFVDTAPVMEKPLAQAAGLGWQGKHTNLVVRDFGSWLFLGAMFTSVALPPDKAEEDHCGACSRCLDICPTKAFPGPYRLDARRCVSYLTIEHKGQIPREFRKAIGNRIYGCDDCLAVCPWNKFAKTAHEAKLAPRAGAENPPLKELLQLDDASFRARFAGSPIKRTGRNRFMRNVLVAAGNSGAKELLPFTIALLADESPLVRGMAVWASFRLLKGDAARAMELKREHYPDEADPLVRQEWEEAAL